MIPPAIHLIPHSAPIWTSSSLFKAEAWHRDGEVRATPRGNETEGGPWIQDDPGHRMSLLDLEEPNSFKIFKLFR